MKHLEIVNINSAMSKEIIETILFYGSIANHTDDTIKKDKGTMARKLLIYLFRKDVQDG